jgi:hypothetical protein
MTIRVSEVQQYFNGAALDVRGVLCRASVQERVGKYLIPKM